jgi:hypothetical protein
MQRSQGCPTKEGNLGYNANVSHNPEGVAQMAATLRNPFRVLVDYWHSFPG